MAFTAAPFADLPIMDQDDPWNPNEDSDAEIQNAILGENLDNWERYRKAHLSWDPDNPETKAGYKLKVARMKDGRLQVNFQQLASRVAIINGAREGVDIPDDVRRSAFNVAMKYYDKFGISDDDRPDFKASLSSGKKRKRDMSVRAASIKLVAPDESDESPKWVQIARAGTFLGYNEGKNPFTLSKSTFETIQRNFRANPAFCIGPDGVGNANVVPWDFEHTSEGMSPLTAVTGAPAAGWVLDLDIRTGQDGEAELWALSKFLEPARGYVLDGQYQWASISVIKNDTDQETGKKIGPRLTSVALTNKPFIAGMEKLVASMGYYGAAETPSDALRAMKDLFGLTGLSDVAAVGAEVSKLKQWIETGTTPLGIEINDLIGALRQILNLPTLTAPIEVLDQASLIIMALIEEQSNNAAGQTAPQAVEPSPGMVVSQTGGEDMELLETLAKKLDVRKSDGEVISAVDDAVNLRAGVRDALGAKKDTQDALLNAIADLQQQASRLDSDKKALGVQLSAITKALGVGAVEDVSEKIVALSTAAAELAEIKPKFEAAQEKIDAEEAKQAEAEVKDVMLGYSLPESIFDALLLFRKEKPEEFVAKYPQPAKTVNMTRNLTSGGALPAATSVETAQRGDANVIDLSIYPGVNDTQKLVAYVKGSVPGAENWSFEEQCKAAFNLRKTAVIKTN